MKNINCVLCGRNIDRARIDVGLDTCMSCAKSVSRVMGYMTFTGKTGGTIEFVSNNDEFKKYRKYAPYGRNTGRGSGIHRISRSTVNM